MTGANTPPPPPPPPPWVPSPAPRKSGQQSVAHWYWQTWVVVIALVLVFPLGLVLLWTRQPQWSLTARWLTSGTVVVLAAIFIALGATAAPQGPNPPGQTPTPAIGGDTPPSTADATPTATFAPTATPTPTPHPTSTPTATPTPPPPPPPPTAPPTAAPTPPPVNLCGAPSNPWNYNFCGGGLIYSPDPSFCNYFQCIPSFWQSTNGYVDQCNDGMYSHSGGRSGACSYHGGEKRPLYS